MFKKLFVAGICATASIISINASFAAKSDDTLRIVWGADGQLINADNYYGATRAGIWFNKMVFDTLIDRDPVSGEYKPNLATAWKWVDDKTLELELRKGVKFHNDQPFTAEDVVYTYNTIAKDEGVKFKRIIDWVDYVEKLDDFTVRIHAKNPFPQAIEFLSGPMPVYPHEYYAKVGPTGMSAKPIGTGPLKVVEMLPGNQYTLVRNDDYNWGSPKGPAKIKNVIIREIPDPQTQIAEIMSGGADVSADLTPDMVKQMEGTPNVNVKNAETYRIFYMGIDTPALSGVAPLKDVRVRQALNHAIDKQAIVDNLMGGAARVIATPCHPLQTGCDESAAVKYPYDPAKAKALLAEAGYPDGFEMALYAEAPAYDAEAVMGYLAAVGIKTKLNRLPWEAYHDAQVAHKTPVWLTNWGSYSLADASASISVFFRGGGDDYTKDETVAELLKQADTSTDEAVRKENYAKAIKHITENAYWVPMFSGIRSYAWNSELDFKPYPDEVPRFYEYGWK